ncbi:MULTISPECIES: response regulator [Methylocystis]|uniref:response regulator n=1 Tax=Methylocystis TaxID=133 RepID=UPI002108E529|nr:response regulator [Methylocystis suflitae]MCQ4191591.1 PAS domain-containing protein [Methylocystis suflitae]
MRALPDHASKINFAVARRASSLAAPAGQQIDIAIVFSTWPSLERPIDDNYQKITRGKAAMTQLGRKANFGLKAAHEERARRNELALRLALGAVPMISFEWDIVRDIVRRFDPFDSDISSSTGMFSRFAAVRDAVHPEDRAQFCADIEAALLGETERFETEIRILGPDGIVTWFRERGVVERDQFGRPLRMIGVAHDVTAQRARPSWEAASACTAANATPSLRALVIDDNREAADALALLLGTVGARVRLAYSGAGGLAALNEFKPPLVFLDIGMPYLDVVELIRRIHVPEGDRISLVALSASRAERTVRLVKDVGFDGLLIKPARFEALLDLLEELSCHVSKRG